MIDSSEAACAAAIGTPVFFEDARLDLIAIVWQPVSGFP